MNHDAILLKEISAEQLIAMFTELKKEIEDIKVNFQPKEPVEYLSRTEAAKLLKCDLSTIHHWTVKGKLKAHGIGNRVFYKRSEIEDSVKPLNSSNID